MPVDTEQRDHILLVTLNRPDKLNALNLEMTDQLTEVWRRFREDDDLWLAIVTGAGDRAFCSGADLGGSGDRPASAGRRPSEEEATALGGYYAWTPVNIWKPVIGAINGYTLAGGLALALSCDLRIASETARIGSMAVKRGRMGGGGATQRLTRYLPFAKGLELLLFGDHVPAAELERFGLVNKVVPPDELMPTAWDWAERICRNGPVAVRASKQAAYQGLELGMREGLRIEAELHHMILQTEDVREGQRAFNEKREPVWKGR